MPMLTENKHEDFATLLAKNVLDASKGVLMANSVGLEPDTTNRTIIIGVGGTGVRTVNYVKGAISKRLKPSWKNYVAFLAVDTSWTELDGATYLETSEQIMITKPGVGPRMSNTRTYPAAVRRFALDATDMSKLGATLSSDGAGRTRLVGKLKIHDRVPGSMGVDEEIVHKLTVMKTDRLLPLTDAQGKYQIYVIGSGSGGTGSGSFMEMPALIRRVFTNPAEVSVNGMLYLPDTLANLDPAHMHELYANGYATLKELNYYTGMYMRPEYAETWSYNDVSTPELTYRTPSMGEEGFLNVPYLIGTVSGPSADSAQVAQETIAEFLISILAKITTVDVGAPFLTSAFESNAMAPAKVSAKEFLPGADELVAKGEAHEFPKRFASIGFAEASVPQKLVRAYTVGRACEMAGLRPISSEQRVAMAAGDATAMLPFRGKDDLFNATEGTAKAAKLLEPLSKIISVIHSGTFNFGQDLNENDITWTKIKNNQYDNPMIKAKTESVIKARTTDTMMDELKKRITEAFRQFRVNVQDFVREEGPYAFANLYEGRFLPVGDNFGRGIGAMIQNLVNGKTMEGKVVQFTSVEDRKSALDSARNNIVSQAPGLFGIEGGVHKQQCSQWVQAYNDWGTARVNKVRRDTALGQQGALCQSFLLPAARLAEEMDAFGCVLETMTDIYQGYGKAMESYDKFSGAKDSKTEVNLAAMSDASYQWLKKKAEDAVATVNAKKIRERLVDHFFAKAEDGTPNSHLWLEYPQARVTSAANGRIKLTQEEMPVPARMVFDKLMAEEFPSTVTVSVEEMFVQLENNGQSVDYVANTVIKNLYAQSKPQFNGDIPADSRFGFIMYPSALSDTAKGKEIAAALCAAAENVCPGIQIYATDDAQSIMFYQQATTLEVYRLQELGLWESYYEKGAKSILVKESYLHGLSPDVTGVTVPGEGTTYTEGLSWTDYPPITVFDGNPRLPDPITGEITREGKFLIELDKMIARARDLGVLYSEKTPMGWIVKRVHCNKSTQWRFDVTECNQDPATGLLPLGKELAEAVASQNSKTLDQMSRTVALNMGGILDKPHISEEKAWEFAAVTLRAHVPMYIEVRETLKKFEVWAEAIEKFNGTIIAQLLPAKMIWLVKGRILRRNEDGTWVYVQADGKTKNVAVLTETMKKFLAPKDKFLVENGLLGYYLYSKLSVILPDLKAFDAAFNRAKTAMENMASEGEIDELTAGDELAALFLAERETLAEKGARLDGSEGEPRSAFVKAFPAIDKEKLQDIDLFYYRTGMWEVL